MASVIGRRCAEFPSGVEQRVQRLLVLEDPDQHEPRDAEAQSRLDLSHLHAGRGLGLVVDGKARARVPALGTVGE